MATETILFLLLLTTSSLLVESGDTNHVYLPCSDTKVQIDDGFTFAIAFAQRTSFIYNNSLQLSPCDRRLALSSANSQIAVFRPKVDEISLLTINTSSFSPVTFSPSLQLSFSYSYCFCCSFDANCFEGFVIVF
ncbi:hypothetical protein Pint_36191 [Pistacia integerrima]|uniref:Uncharacterized protein n=1 Tax=Pistacia integerrima TaxID=434235 RepID=A0ACC0Y364_9ROSI|nr:hypothetical protein Pint_36191 [Pistacia integerrima]